MSPLTVSVASLLRRGTAALAMASDSARLDAELLLAHVLQVTRATLFAQQEREVAAEDLARYEQLLARRAGGEPVAYIVGEKEFWSLPLQVSPAVLIPRPETELLVERTLALLPASPCDVADLGTGSGAVALALARERPQWRIVATDASEVALEQARANATRLGLTQLRFVPGDWCAPLVGERFTALVSNPPYVAAGDAALEALAHEPGMALAADDGGYEQLARIVQQAPRHLERDGWLLLEHGATQAARLAELLVGRGFARVVCHPDLAGLPRVTEAQWLHPHK